MSNIRNDDNKLTIVRGGGGPCGACRFLRRKCVKSCIFAPYFGSDQLGTCQFAAVHRVFGASNASKILVTIPPHKRPDAVVSLCYEALSRLSDPVYGCVSHIFTLQRQVDDLQAELACIRARLMNLHCPLVLPPDPHLQSSSSLQTVLDIKISNQLANSQSKQTPVEMTSSICASTRGEENYQVEDSHDDDDDDLQRLARELVAKYLPGLTFSSSN